MQSVHWKEMTCSLDYCDSHNQRTTWCLFHLTLDHYGTVISNNGFVVESVAMHIITGNIKQHISFSHLTFLNV